MGLWGTFMPLQYVAFDSRKNKQTNLTSSICLTSQLCNLLCFTEGREVYYYSSTCATLTIYINYIYVCTYIFIVHSIFSLKCFCITRVFNNILPLNTPTCQCVLLDSFSFRCMVELLLNDEALKQNCFIVLEMSNIK